ncbi:MAG: RHS repeat-associated core domain-containing protein [Candidatus Kapaibacterium sp.]|nr:MAG: RHS repeat-associated core domain-containing protein [Candidatus Kapabacteria bacterium]
MVVRHHIFAPFLITYDPDGAMVYSKRDGVEGGLAFQRIEEYAWNAFNLLEQFTVRTDAVAEGGGPGCEPDATTMPADVWRYRFNPMQEREQKRQEITSGNVVRDGLAWTYTLLGADTKQLATYNGIEGAFCGQPSVWMWPVEYNSYGPANTRVILRPNGTKEYVIADHLGSPRITVNDQGAILQHTTYAPFGSVLTTTGSGQRTSYIGREADNETGLGNYGVRLYEPEYGRFMSVDVLWGEYENVNSYHYALNRPTVLLDYTGLDTTQRVKMVAFAQSYLNSGSTYSLGAKGPPGKPVDCSGLVNNCMVAGGEPTTLREDIPGTGVQKIEAVGESTSVTNAQPGNVVTFRTGGWGYHTGLITVVRKDESGKVIEVEFIHSSSSANGPTTGTISFTTKNYWYRHLHGVYKVDSRPDNCSHGMEATPSSTGDGVTSPRLKQLDDN